MGQSYNFIFPKRICKRICDFFFSIFKITGCYLWFHYQILTADPMTKSVAVRIEIEKKKKKKTIKGRLTKKISSTQSSVTRFDESHTLWVQCTAGIKIHISATSNGLQRDRQRCVLRDQNPTTTNRVQIFVLRLLRRNIHSIVEIFSLYNRNNGVQRIRGTRRPTMEQSNLPEAFSPKNF